jgi:hypothetical protein
MNPYILVQTYRNKNTKTWHGNEISFYGFNFVKHQPWSKGKFRSDREGGHCGTSTNGMGLMLDARFFICWIWCLHLSYAEVISNI